MKNRLMELIGNIVTNASDDRTFEDIIATELLANGVIVPPCKENEALFVISNGRIIETYARTFTYYGEDIGLEVETTRYEKDRGGWLKLKRKIIHANEFGKTVFLTREEAEKALERSEE